MNAIYKTPLLTSWPVPIDLKECFTVKKTAFKKKFKRFRNEMEKLYPLSRLLNLF